MVKLLHISQRLYRNGSKKGAKYRHLVEYTTGSNGSFWNEWNESSFKWRSYAREIGGGLKVVLKDMLKCIFNGAEPEFSALM